jgi:HK97 family phage portal protein
MARAKTAQQIVLQVLDTKGEEIDEHPLLDLIHRPNDQMNESDFWAAVTIFQALAGRAVFEIEYANRGLPIALWSLRPDWIFVKQFIDRPSIEYYEYRVPGLQPVMMKPEQVLDFPLFDPLDKFKSFPPVAVAGRVGDVDNAATDLIKLIFENGGMPLGYLKTT